jgi:hypothetical protein
MQMSKCNTAYKQNQGQNHMIISINAEKAFNKIQNTFYDENLEETRNRRSILSIYDTPIANVIAYGGKLYIL